MVAPQVVLVRRAGGRARALRVLLALLATTAAFVVLPAGGRADPAPGTMIETLVPSQAPDASIVSESYVKLYDPLPSSDPPHPAACDWIGYLRFRDSAGPTDAERADAIMVFEPGGSEGPSAIDQLARHVVEDAAAAHRFVEVWSLDRRENCLEDPTGIDAAAAAHNPLVAYDYYWGGLAVDGMKFAGWVPPSAAQWLYHVGLAQTVQDYYDVLRYSLPDPAVRRRKVICAAHSIGGPVLAAFANWNFGEDPSSDVNAGYNQCAAYVAFDTTLAVNDISGLAPSSSANALIELANSSSSPFTDVPPLAPETVELADVFGVGAYYDPDGTDVVAELPQTPNVELASRLLFSQTPLNFLIDFPTIQDFRLTNEAALGGVFDNNSEPIFALRASLGFFTGGPLGEKQFPPPADPTMAIPTEPFFPLYSWLDYNQVTNANGAPYTCRDCEVSDITQFARNLFEAPGGVIEQYFPTQINTDLTAAAAGNRSGTLSHLQYSDGIDLHPELVITAGNSQGNVGPATGIPIVDPPPNGQPLSRAITIPGYTHLDVLTAARVQNNGLPEPVSANVASFMLQLVRDRKHGFGSAEQ